MTYPSRWTPTPHGVTGRTAYDPRGQCTRLPPAGDSPGASPGQRQPGLPGVRDLPHPVLPVAAPVPGLRTRWTVSQAPWAKPRPASHPQCGGLTGPPRGGPGASYLGPRAHRRPPGPPRARRLEPRPGHHLPVPAPRGPADPLQAAGGPGGAQRPDGRAAHRSDPARVVCSSTPPTPSRGGGAARRAGLLGHLLRREAQGGGKGLAVHRLLLRRGPGQHRVLRPGGRPLPHRPGAPGLPGRWMAPQAGAHRLRQRVPTKPVPSTESGIPAPGLVTPGRAASSSACRAPSSPSCGGRFFTHLRALQAALDRYLEFYNHRQPHTGYRTRGRPPAELFWGITGRKDHDQAPNP
jgi:hypothetical protein